MSVNEKNESQVKTSDKKESFKKDEHYVIKKNQQMMNLQRDVVAKYVIMIIHSPLQLAI